MAHCTKKPRNRLVRPPADEASNCCNPSSAISYRTLCTNHVSSTADGGGVLLMAYGPEAPTERLAIVVAYATREIARSQDRKIARSQDRKIARFDMSNPSPEPTVITGKNSPNYRPVLCSISGCAAGPNSWSIDAITARGPLRVVSSKRASHWAIKRSAKRDNGRSKRLLQCAASCRPPKGDSLHFP